MVLWFLSLDLILWLTTLVDLWIFSHPCICRMKSTLWWWVIFWMCSWVQFASILCQTFISLFSSGRFLLLVCLYLSFYLSVFVSGNNWKVYRHRKPISTLILDIISFQFYHSLYWILSPNGTRVLQTISEIL